MNDVLGHDEDVNDDDSNGDGDVEEHVLLVGKHGNCKDFNGEEVDNRNHATLDADVDAETFGHLFNHLSDIDNESNSNSSLQPVLILLQIPLYRSLLCGMVWHL